MFENYYNVENYFLGNYSSLLFDTNISAKLYKQ